ncbi:hypothetical protein [Sphingomonas sp. PAMC 26621]|uniref:hypothetical protein n=1 Tax=Sphingomonas sp. PAMC 26621 TaxID=1112213 RepID=UPI00111119FB|nr:hypothetical protein [Sphingomonas sp. PAMC 26621]
MRETGFRRHEILMLHRDPEDVIPMARTIWTVTCPNPATRDRLLRWLQDRMDRWTGWGEMAMDHCAHAPSQHVLALVMQDPGMARPTVGLPTEGLTADRPPLR